MRTAKRILQIAAEVLIAAAPVWAQTAAPSPPTAVTKIKVPALVLTATANGFDQSAVTVNHLIFFLIVRNASGTPELAYHVIPDVGAAVSHLELHATNPRGATLLKLTPGGYTITEADHPSWQCRLTVSPGAK